MAASLKQIATCIGLSGDFSVVRDFYGYLTGPPKTLSLLTQVRLLQGKHIHLNLIRTAAPFQPPVQKQIDAGLQFMRDTYATVSLGVGRIQRFFVPQGGYEIIMADDVAMDLFDSFSAPGDGIDVFLSLLIAGPAAGMTPTPGSCDKDGKDSGSVIGVLDSGGLLGVVFAHEVGHYLDLEHDEDDPNNLMFPTAPNGGQLSGGQGSTMRGHCAVKPGCGP